MSPAERYAEAAAALSEHDAVLAPIIATSGPVGIEPHTDYFRALAGSVIGQQLSVRAARTIRDRFAVLGGEAFPTPDQISGLSDEVLRGVGLSGAKVMYMRDLAAHILDGRLDLERLPGLTNEEIIVEVTDVKGIGEWTAHMFLIFSLGRLDVLPTGDLGIRKGIQGLYGFDALPTPAEMYSVAERHAWTGYESVASWYVWRSLDLDVVI